MPFWVIAGLVVAGLLAVVAYQELRPRREQRHPPLEVPGLAPGGERPPPGALLSAAEAEFFRVLRHAVGGRYVPLAKVHLLPLVPGLAGTSGATESLYRCADFVLLEAESLQPALVLQYDTERGMRRDGLVAALLSRSGLAVVEVSGQVDWTAQSLASMIADALAGPSRL